jgi:hypothetical protein
MAESAEAETASTHTLTARPCSYPIVDKDRRLQAVTDNLLKLPAEIRSKIYDLAFDGNRVAVSASNGCYCASDATGPYQEDHRWLLKTVKDRVQQDAQSAFIRRAVWELHCEAAFKFFIAKMAALKALSEVRHIRVSVFETSREYWYLPLHKLPQLKSVTFAPWQKGWTIDVAAKDGSDQLTDASIMQKVKDVMCYKDGYEPVRDLIHSQRQYTIHFVFPIRYLLPGKVLPYRWQLRVSHAMPLMIGTHRP